MGQNGGGLGLARPTSDGPVAGHRGGVGQRAKGAGWAQPSDASPTSAHCHP